MLLKASDTSLTELTAKPTAVSAPHAHGPRLGRAHLAASIAGPAFASPAPHGRARLEPGPRRVGLTPVPVHLARAQAGTARAQRNLVNRAHQVIRTVRAAWARSLRHLSSGTRTRVARPLGSAPSCAAANSARLDVVDRSLCSGG